MQQTGIPKRFLNFPRSGNVHYVFDHRGLVGVEYGQFWWVFPPPTYRVSLSSNTVVCIWYYRWHILIYTFPAVAKISPQSFSFSPVLFWIFAFMCCSCNRVHRIYFCLFLFLLFRFYFYITSFLWFNSYTCGMNMSYKLQEWLCNI